MFSKHNPMYFVFSNPEETFFHDSMFRVSREDFVWYKLQKCGYKYSYFLWDDGEENVSIHVLDPESYKVNKYGSLLSSKVLWKTKGILPRKGFPKAAVSEVRKWLISRSKEDDTAIVFDLKTARLLLDHNASDADKLIRCLYKGEASIVLLLPMKFSEFDMKILIGENGLFSGKTGKLFEPADTIVKTADAGTFLFDELRRQASDEVIELGYLGYDELRALMRNVGSAVGTPFTEEELDDHATFLDQWLGRRTVREDFPELFSQFHGKITRNQLYDAFLGNEMSVLIACENKLRKRYILHSGALAQSGEIPAVLEEFYGVARTDFSVSHTVMNQDVINKLNEMQFDRYNSDRYSSFVISELTESDWNGMKRMVSKPRCYMVNEEKLRIILKFIELVEDPAVSDDYDTLQRAHNIIAYFGNNLYTLSEERFGEEASLANRYLMLSQDYYKQKTMLRTIKFHGGEAEKPLIKEMVFRAEQKLAAWFDYLKDFDAFYSQFDPVSKPNIDMSLSEEQFEIATLAEAKRKRLEQMTEQMTIDEI